MDPEIVKQVQSSNEAAMALVTLLVSEESHEAVVMAMTDLAFTQRSTCLAIAVLASSAIKSLALVLECEPEDVMKEAAINTALFNMKLEEE